jgi:hypothetical protein
MGQGRFVGLAGFCKALLGLALVIDFVRVVLATWERSLALQLEILFNILDLTTSRDSFSSIKKKKKKQAKVRV